MDLNVEISTISIQDFEMKSQPKTEDDKFWDKLAANAIEAKRQAITQRDIALRENRDLKAQIAMLGAGAVKAEHAIMLKRAVTRSRERAWHRCQTEGGSDAAEAKGEFRAYADVLAVMEDLVAGRKIG